MIDEYRSHRGKRNKRRDKRAAVLGPERRIVRTACGAHLLECGHQVLVLPTENPHIRRRRCEQCLQPSLARGLEPSLARSINVRLGDVDGDGLPFVCEDCGASRSVGPVEGVPGVRGRCRECHALVSEADAESLAKARRIFVEATGMEDGGIDETAFGAEPTDEDLSGGES